MGPIARAVSFTESQICLTLADGRQVVTPLEFYPRLANATQEQLRKCKIMWRGTGIHWDEIDEDLSIEAMVLRLRSMF